MSSNLARGTDYFEWFRGFLQPLEAHSEMLTRLHQGRFFHNYYSSILMQPGAV
jgi:hypothetical protein